MERRVAGCHLCWHQCEVELTIEDGLLKQVEPCSNSVISSGCGCERLAGTVEFHYGKRRLNHPLRRVGKRGSGAWEEVSWDEALDDIAAQLAEIRDEDGPEAVAKIGGTIHGPGDWAAWRFFNQWGSPNILNLGKNCGQANTTVECAMYGWDSLGGIGDYSKSRNIVLWGSNPPESNPIKWNAIRVAQSMGTRVIVIDPRYSEAASFADLWLQPLPGTDGALGWGVIHVLIEEDLYDRDFVNQWCSGFDEVRDRAREYSPELVSKITGVPAERIIEFARIYADGPTYYAWSLSQCHLGAGAGYPAAYTQAVIRAITGNIDREGGNLLTAPLPDGVDWDGVLDWDALEQNLRESSRDCVTADKFPVCSKASLFAFNEAAMKAWGVRYGCPLYFLYPSSRGIYDAILEEKPYPIRALFIQGGNPLITLADAKRGMDALLKVDLLVGMDFFMTPSMALCDYVLPAASWLERPHLMTFWGITPVCAAYRQPMDILYERKDDYFLWKELAHRLHLPYEWLETLERMYDKMLEPSGLTLGELADRSDHFLTNDTGKVFERYAKNAHGFATPSGKCELAPTLLERAGLDPVPSYEPSPLSAAGDAVMCRDYPLLLISGARVRPYWHTSYREVRSIRWRHEYPEVQIHPETARAFGISAGDTVYVETPRGRIKQRASVTTAVQPGVIHAEAFWFYPEQKQSLPELCGAWISNVNAILPDDYEYCDFAGDLPLRGVLCRVYKAEQSLDLDLPDYAQSL